MNRNVIRLVETFAVVFVGLATLALPAAAQQRACDIGQHYGGDSSVTLVNAIERIGTSRANMNALDGSYYELSNDAGFTQVLFATEMISDSAADNDRAPFGLIFINPTNTPITITQVDVASDPAKTGIWRASPAPVGITPIAGWSWVNSRVVRWNGSVEVPAHGGIDFIVEAKISNLGVDILDNVVTATCVTSVGNYTAVGYATNVFVPTASQKVATGVVAFSTGGFPRGYITGLTGGVPNDVAVRIQEYANNQAIERNLELSVTIPPGWTNVSVVSAPAPFDPSSVSIIPATASTEGLLRVRTLNSNAGIIGKGTTTPEFVFRGTPPIAYADSVYSMRLRLNGTDTSNQRHPVRSVCDGVLQVSPQARAGINVEFLSPPLTTAAPIRSAELQVALNSVNGLGNETYSLDVYNFATNSWDVGTVVTPSSSNTTLSQSFTSANIDSYLNGSDQMRVRIYSPDSATTRTLRVDFMSWENVVRGWSVDNSHPLANDANRGSVSRPLATIQAALSRAAGGDAIYVQGTAIAYAANLSLDAAKSGIAGCETMVFGLPDTITGQRPMVVGTNPSSDHGFALEGSFQHVEGFDISSTQVALFSAPGTIGSIFGNNGATVPDLGYGVLLNGSTSVRVTNNLVVASGTRSQFGVWAYGGGNHVIDGNVIIGHGSAGIQTSSSAGLLIRRNVLKGNYFGVYFANGSGTLYNNTIDGSRNIGAYSQSAAVTSRNNILVNGAKGWQKNTTGVVSSNYDNVFNNTMNYVSVIPGANSISADPQFVQTADPTVNTFYRLSGGSTCANAGTNVGLPFSGSNPDIGAIESF